MPEPRQPAADALRSALAERVVVADGAMGTMLQAHDLGPDDFQGHEGCNEILNLSRPDVVRAVHDAYLAVGVDAVETNTFGANYANLGEYGIEERITELSTAGARLAREVADGWSTPGAPRWVLGSVGPGTKLPTFGHVTYAVLRDTYQAQVDGLVAGGVDAIMIETCQDLLQAKAAVVGAKRSLASSGAQLPIFVNVTVETTGTMLVGSEIGAALTALEPLGIEMIGLNCATGPAEMSEHLRHLARHARVGLACMPNAGLPELRASGAWYPLTPAELADAHDVFTRDYGLSLVGGCCGTTPEHMREVVKRVRGRELRPRDPRPEPGASSLYQSVPFRQDTAYLSVGERTNANGSKAFREAMLEQRWDDCVRIAKDQIRDGAHMLDVNTDYVGRDGAADMREMVSRLATASTLPLVIDSTEPDVVEAGLELLGGRAVVNSVNYEDGTGPKSRMHRMMKVVKEHGAAVVALTIDEQGQARTAEWKTRVADRLITDLVDDWGMREDDIVVDALTFPIATGQEETRRDGIETIEAIRAIKAAHPRAQTILGVSNVSFGLNPAARVVLNSVFLHECVEAGLDSAIVHPSKILPMARIPDEQRQAALDLVHDRREYAADGSLTFDPLSHYLSVFEGVDVAAMAKERADALAGLELFERLARRIVDGERDGLEADLDEALQTKSALDIVNENLLDGMKTVGELFGRGEMQLPFVLQSAEVMKAAVAYLEPHMEQVGHHRQGHHRARHRQGRRPRHRQEPGRHHLDQQRLHRGQPRHQGAGHRHPRAGAGARRGRDRHERVAGQEHGGDAREPRGGQPPWDRGAVPGAARRRRPDPGLRRAGSGRAVPRDCPLRPRRVRGAAADGHDDGHQARCPRCRAPRAAQAAGERGHGGAGSDRARGHAGPFRRRARRADPDAAVLGHPGGQGHRPCRLRHLP
jgi:5-methyltetrahydrofolate--homocysteine methyltransferase